MKEIFCYMTVCIPTSLDGIILTTQYNCDRCKVYIHQHRNMLIVQKNQKNWSLTVDFFVGQCSENCNYHILKKFQRPQFFMNCLENQHEYSYESYSQSYLSI